MFKNKCTDVQQILLNVSTANEIRERYVTKERRKDKETCYLKQ